MTNHWPDRRNKEAQMTNKNIIYLFIFVSLAFLSKEALANTDILSDVMSTINSTLKEVGEVQNKISGKTREIISKKVAPEGLMNGVEAMREKAEKLKQIGENAKDKADKVRRFAEAAKEKKEEYMAKYQALNDFANEKFAQANAAYDEYKAIYESYRVKPQEYTEAMDGEEGGQQGDNGVDGGAGSGSSSGASTSGEGGRGENYGVESPMGMINNPTAVKASEAQTTPLTTPLGRAGLTASSLDRGNLTASSLGRAGLTASPANAANVTAIPTAARADVISEANMLATKSIADSRESVIIPNTDIIEASKVKITSDDIEENIAAQKQKTRLTTKEVSTEVNLKDQLIGSANKELSASKDENQKNVKPEKSADNQNNQIKPAKNAGKEQNSAERTKSLSSDVFASKTISATKENMTAKNQPEKQSSQDITSKQRRE